MSLLDQSTATDLVELVLGTTVREYPHFLQQELASDADLQPPRRLNPAFFGCYDWHSAVHSHWLPTYLLYLDERLSAR